MKKIICALAIVAVAITSCSSDASSDQNPSNDVLVRKIMYDYGSENYGDTVEYTYNGTKLLKGIFSDGSVETFTYSGDVITKIERKEGSEVIYTENFIYDSSNRLIKYNMLENGYDEQETFVYNNDGTATATYGTGVGAYVRNYYYENDELIKIVGSDGHTYNYTYDNKNSPYRNVTGYDKIVLVVHGDNEFFGSKQNIVRIYDATDGINYMSNTMTYNSSDYPVAAISTAIFYPGTTDVATAQYSY